MILARDILIVILFVFLFVVVVGYSRADKLSKELTEDIEAAEFLLTDINLKLSNERITTTKLRQGIEDIKTDMERLLALRPIIDLLDPIDKDYMLRHLNPGRVFDSKTRMTSSFGESTGIGQLWRNGHRGLDLVPEGDWHILAPWSGYSSSIGIDEIYGKFIIVHVTDTLRFKVAHLSSIFYTASPGEYIEAGDVIGVMGNTGMSDGAHLHFELQVLIGEDWRAIDCEPWVDRS